MIINQKIFMPLHFSEPIDKTKKNSAVFEFFTESDDFRNTKTTRIKGKSLARLIEERKIDKYYKRKKHISVQLKLLQIFVILGIIISISVILLLLWKII